MKIDRIPFSTSANYEAIPRDSTPDKDDLCAFGPIGARVFKLNGGDLIENREIAEWIDDQGRQLVIKLASDK